MQRQFCWHCDKQMPRTVRKWRERRFSGIGRMAEMAETQEFLSGRASTTLAL